MQQAYTSGRGMGDRSVWTAILVLVYLPVCPSMVEDQCLFKFESMCITATNFSSWQEARIECIKLGGDLWVPDSSEAEAFLQNKTESALWIGGRKTRIWLRDRTYYYRGKWIGCVGPLPHGTLRFNESKTDSLSECLEFCSKLNYSFATYQRRRCMCTQNKPQTADCPEHFTWIPNDKGQANGTHVFELIPLRYSTDNMRIRVKAVNTSGGYSLNLTTKNLTTRKKPLCQFSARCNQCVQYGETFLHSKNYSTLNWSQIWNHCTGQKGSLAKLDWESPMIAKELYNHYNESSWIGVSRVDFFYINGKEVFKGRPKSGSIGNIECVVWQRSQAERSNCSRNDSIPAACNLPPETTTPLRSTQPSAVLPTAVTSIPEPTTSNLPTTDTSVVHPGTTDWLTASEQSTDVKVAVGVSIGVVAVVLLLLLVIWRIRRMRRSESDKSSTASPVENVNQINGNDENENEESKRDSLQAYVHDSRISEDNLGTSNRETENPDPMREINNAELYDKLYAVPHKAVAEKPKVGPQDEQEVERKQGTSLYQNIVQDESYDKLEIQTANGPERYREPPPSYSVIPFYKLPDYDHMSRVTK